MVEQITVLFIRSTCNILSRLLMLTWVERRGYDFLNPLNFIVQGEN